MNVINWFIKNLENLYFFAGILLSSTIGISILQYKFAKRESKKEEINNINEATSELLIEYHRNIIPSFSKLKKSLKGNFFSLDRKDLFCNSVEIKESARQYYNTVNQYLIFDFEELLSYMQSFAVKYELSDCNKSAIERTIGKSFTDIFEVIVPCIFENEYEYFNELISVYNTFNLNIQKKINENQLDETNKKIEQNNLTKKEIKIKWRR